MATFVKLITMDLVGGLTRNGYQAKSESVYAGSKKKGTLAFTVSPVVQAISGLRSAMKRPRSAWDEYIKSVSHRILAYPSAQFGVRVLCVERRKVRIVSTQNLRVHPAAIWASQGGK